MMIKTIAIATLAALIALPVAGNAGSPQEELKAFQDYFKDRFPDTPFMDFQNGV